MTAIYTTELTASRKSRMPWRTVLEVARHLNALVFSGDGKSCETEIDGVRVEYINKPFDYDSAQYLVERMKKQGVVRLYFSIVPGRIYHELQNACDDAGIEIVWYIASSWNSLGRVFRAWRWIGFKAIRSYLIQALVPKRIWIKNLNSRRVRPIITMSNFTARKLIDCNYSDNFVHAILPGLDEIKESDTDKLCLKSSIEPYFLFFGPPQKIRGIYLILEAVKKLSRKRKDFRLIALVRTDENARRETEELKAYIAKMCCDQIEASFGFVSSDEINNYIDGSVAILKPFVLVPSEIPLAPMEAMQRGKLVIGFRGDGTGELIRGHGIAIKHCDIEALTETMNRVLDNKFTCKSFVYKTWIDVAKEWRNV